MLSTPNHQPHHRSSQANDLQAQNADALGGDGARKTLLSYQYKNILLSLGVFGLSIGLSGLFLKKGFDGFEQSYFILSYQQPAWYAGLEAEVDSASKNSLSTLQDTITSEFILSQVVAQVKDSYPDITVEELGNQLTVKAVPTSPVDPEKAAGEVGGAIRVEFNDRDHEKAQLILSVLQKTYLTYYQQKQQVDFIKVSSSLDEQLRENMLAAGELELKLTELYRVHPFLSQAFTKDHGGIDGAQKTLQQNRDQLRSELDNYQQQLASVRSGQNNEPSLSLQDGSSFQGALVLDQKINAIEQQYNAHLNKYNQTPNQFNNLNPSNLDQAPPKLLSPQTNNSLFILRNVAPDAGQIQQELEGEIKTRSLVSKIEEIKAQLTTVEATIAELPNLRYQSQQWQVELGNLQKKQDELIARQQELEASKSKVGASLQLLPTDGDRKIAIPQTKLLWQITLIKILLSAGLGYLAYRYLNQLDFEIETIEDIETVIGGQPIAVIPKIKLNPHKPSAHKNYTAKINPLVLGTNPAFVREIATIADRLINHQKQDHNFKVIAITSSFAGEGKSHTVYEVADQLAKDGFNTLIIDADLRKPTIHHLCQVSNDSGLTDILTYQYEETIDQVIKPSTTNPNLKILPSGPLPINPLTLLNNPRIVGLIKELKAQYDFMLIDLPPIICLEDMKFILNQCDGTLVNCRLGRSTYKSLMYCLEQINRYQGNNLGVIANFCPSASVAPEVVNLSLADHDQQPELGDVNNDQQRKGHILGTMPHSFNIKKTL